MYTMSYGYSGVVQTGGYSSSNGGRSFVEDSIAKKLGEGPEPIGSLHHKNPGPLSDSNEKGGKSRRGHRG